MQGWQKGHQGIHVGRGGMPGHAAALEINKLKLGRKEMRLLCQEELRSMESPDRRLCCQWM